MNLSKKEPSSVFWLNMDKCQRDVENWPEWSRVSLTKYGGTMNSRGLQDKALKEIKERKNERVKNLFKSKYREIENQEQIVRQAQEKLDSMEKEYRDMGDRSVEQLYEEYTDTPAVYSLVMDISQQGSSYSVFHLYPFT